MCIHTLQKEELRAHSPQQIAWQLSHTFVAPQWSPQASQCGSGLQQKLYHVVVVQQKLYHVVVVQQKLYHVVVACNQNYITWLLPANGYAMHTYIHAYIDKKMNGHVHI
jgi:hypothetical protein